jgi:hypothetical protein
MSKYPGMTPNTYQPCEGGLTMAAIDKTYGTYEQSVQLWRWLRRRGRKRLRAHYGPENYGHLLPDELRPIINTRTSDDKWMARFCPFPFVLERICEVYPRGHVAARIASERLAIREPSDG